MQDAFGQIFTLLILSLVVASISWTVTQEEIFSEWRRFCDERRKGAGNILVRKFFYVFTCEYCFSHWVTIAILALSGFHLLIADWRGYVLAFFALPWVANQWMSLYRRIRVEIKHEDVLAKKAASKLETKD